MQILDEVDSASLRENRLLRLDILLGKQDRVLYWTCAGDNDTYSLSYAALRSEVMARQEDDPRGP